MPAHLNRKQQREIKAVVERAKKDNGIPQTAQQSIPFQRMFPDGICRVTDNYYTKTIQYQDINYQLAQQEDKTAIFDEWCSFLNFFDSSIHFELSLENDLRSQVDNIESTHPGYDEYRYALDEIGHNPYELAAYLTVVFEDYTREEVQAELVRLFEEQYDLELDEEVEIRSYTTTDEDGNTSTVYYEYRILNVTLTNYGLGNVIASSRLTAEQWERYKVLLETLGNRSYLFGEDVSSAPGGGGEYTDYDIPGEALTDTAFANMVREAEKYLGYPYVWGGSSPSTSFDCSGFVSWVINNCGNGWSVGRQTANGLKNLCDIIPPSEAKPGDLIFFQGTYNTSGASHVGIYVGNGMMIHCGDPISYASIETNYWQQHFYCFGRIP